MMRRANASVQLLLIGKAAGTRAEAGGIRFSALMIAAFLLPLGLALPMLAAATLQGRDERAAGFTFTSAEEVDPGASTVLVVDDLDALPNSRQFQVLYLTPLGEDAPLPPGIGRWPQPGEVLLSPKLAELGASFDIDERYGTVVGTINTAELVDPDQLFAYVVPAQPIDRSVADRAPLVEVTAWGTDCDPVASANWLLLKQDYFDLGFYAITVFLVTIPAGVLAFAATRVASHARDRREVLIRLLGGRPRHTVLVALGESWAPVAIGTGAALLGLLALGWTNLDLPYVDFTLSARDVRNAWPWTFGGLAVSFTALMSMTLLVSTGRLQGRAPVTAGGARRHRAVTSLAWGFPICFVIAAWGPSLFPFQSPFFFLLNYIGQLGLIITVAPAVALACAWLAGVAGRLRWVRWRPSLLSSAARVAAYPQATARQLTAVIAAFFVVFFSLAYHSNWTSWVEEDRAAVAPLGGSMAEVRPSNAVFTETETDQFLDRLPTDLSVLAVHVDQGYDDGSESIEMVGDCEALAAFSLECPEGSDTITGTVPDDRLAHWVGLHFPLEAPEISIVSGSATRVPSMVDPENRTTTVLLISTFDGSPIPESDMRIAGTVFQFGVMIDAPGLAETGTTQSEEQSHWIIAFGTIALAVLALASVLGASGEFLRHGRALAPIGVLTGGLRTFRAASAVTVFGPLLVGSAVGVGVGIAASDSLMRPGTTLVRAGIIAPTLLVLFTVTAVMWWWASSVAIREAGRWRPGRGD
ncbi:hypothetical protein [Glycomyces paridis]|uniref:FtsX-like permease family protein n=1 Tax=Glycomyces paridis TaxID=2126555 RepID=A0A4V4HPJ3_9ACTN|nr:hypothetical protein [Glycomyces paridis]THV30016.1 hypothetical protein E9998_06425 [Glycomyces paridis]